MEFPSDRTVEVEIEADKAEKIWKQAFKYASDMLSTLDKDDYEGYGELYDYYVMEYFSQVFPMTDDLECTLRYYLERSREAQSETPHELIADEDES